jgi:hypothetical protein
MAGSTHQWIKGEMSDLIITFDHVDSEHYSMFFVDEEVTNSSFLGVKETILDSAPDFTNKHPSSVHLNSSR